METAHGGFGERPGETDRSNPGTAPQADSTEPPFGANIASMTVRIWLGHI